MSTLSLYMSLVLTTDIHKSLNSDVHEVPKVCCSVCIIYEGTQVQQDKGLGRLFSDSASCLLMT